MDKIEFNNSRILELLSKYLINNDKLINSEKINKIKGLGIDDRLCFAYLLGESLGIDTEKTDREFFNNYLLPSINLLNVEDYLNDDYYKTIGLFNSKNNNNCFSIGKYLPYQGFVSDDIKIFFDNRKIPQIGFFNCEYSFLQLATNDNQWMSVTPNEINTIRKPILNAYGNVATYGLGLGYYLFHAAKKENVKKVVAVEIDNNLIELFKNSVLIRFPDYIKNKIEIINDDAFNFAKNKAKNYDCIFADIWHDVSDGLDIYLKLKELELSSVHYDYWIEKTIKCYL